jgi:hypothetical protein
MNMPDNEYEPVLEVETTWQIQWRHLNEPDQWLGPHWVARSEAAANAAVTELREHPTADKRRYRVVKVTVTRELVDGG